MQFRVFREHLTDSSADIAKEREGKEKEKKGGGKMTLVVPCRSYRHYKEKRIPGRGGRARSSAAMAKFDRSSIAHQRSKKKGSSQKKKRKKKDIGRLRSRIPARVPMEGKGGGGNKAQ